ncbi:amidase [Rhodoligotrophos appendicifer]|uniref:amidase n=1 Tax=Rhodoligotrophos appendicifer TaxID=987056 RepID=UPI0011867ECE|nr:amidase [Rhodoligotrophos appendicifer]
MSDYSFASATALVSALHSGAISSRELLEMFWARVEKFNPALNAIIWSDIEAARAAAEAADRRLSSGTPLGLLDGLPMTIKESFQLAGSPTTWGDPTFRDNVTDTDADAVKRLKAQGAIIFAKTNVPLMLADWQSFNDIYGTTNNPWDVTRVPGGSSGGSAAALAAGLTGLDVGSDIGASIRNPAHYCGVYGHKPTYGIVSYRGHALPGGVTTSDITVAGPLARSATDLSLALGIIEGPEDIDAMGWRLVLPRAQKKHFKDLKIAVMLNDKASDVDQSIQAELVKLAEFLEKQGAKIDFKARPRFETSEVVDVYIALLRAATSRRQTGRDFLRNVELSQSLPVEDQSYFARMVRANVLPHREWLKINERRHHMRLAWADFFREWDLMLCPAAASAAFPHDQVGERHQRTIEVNAKRVPTTDQLFWAGYSGCFYLPSTIAPIGSDPMGLPIGVQIIGAQYFDYSTIAFAELLEHEYRGFIAPPGFR